MMHSTARRLRHRKALPSGFTLIELMVSITISLVLLLALISVMVNTSRNNNELAKTNSQIENGRFAIQLLQNDLAHAGFWGSYVPEFDDQVANSTSAPTDYPTAVPNPCLAYANWNAGHKINLIGIPVQAYDSVPSGCEALITDRKDDTDVLVVRHAATCLPGTANCESDTSGELYFQSPLCTAEVSGKAQNGSATTITLDPVASAIDNAYAGLKIRIIKGNVTEFREISEYSGSTKVATVSQAWSPTATPNSSTAYAMDYALGTGPFPFRSRDCTTATPTPAAKRKFQSTIYYIRNYAATPGDGVPTLVRSDFGLASGTLAQQPAIPLIDGIEDFKVELGIDNQVGRCSPATQVNYSQAVERRDPSTCAVHPTASNNTLPINRGDGIPDGSFKRCTTAAPCGVDDLANAVAAKVHILARSREESPGHTDKKTYALGTSTVPAFNDHFKRHVFSTTVRLTNVSGRRETP